MRKAGPPVAPAGPLLTIRNAGISMHRTTYGRCAMRVNVFWQCCRVFGPLLALGLGPAVRGQPGEQGQSADLLLSGGPRNLAVLDFRVIGQGVDPAAGEALAAVVRSALVRGDNVRVIEREALAAILREQDLQVTDMVDPATAVKIGRIAGPPARRLRRRSSS